MYKCPYCNWKSSYKSMVETHARNCLYKPSQYSCDIVEDVIDIATGIGIGLAIGSLFDNDSSSGSDFSGGGGGDFGGGGSSGDW